LNTQAVNFRHSHFGHQHQFWMPRRDDMEGTPEGKQEWAKKKRNTILQAKWLNLDKLPYFAPDSLQASQQRPWQQNRCNSPPTAFFDVRSELSGTGQFDSILSSLYDHHCISKSQGIRSYKGHALIKLGMHKTVRTYKKLKKKQEITYCVEANVLPSGLNAAAIVDRGAGWRGQYLAVQWRRDSASNLHPNHVTLLNNLQVIHKSPPHVTLK